MAPNKSDAIGATDELWACPAASDAIVWRGSQKH